MDRPPMAPPLTSAQLSGIFRTLGVEFGVDSPALGEQQLTLSLAHGLIGAAEQHAMRAEEAARAAGATAQDVAQATGQAFMAAGARTVIEDIALLSWRIQRTTQAIIEVNQRNRPDELMKTITLLTAALSGLLSAAHTMRDPHRGLDDTHDAARAVRAAHAALNKAITDPPGLPALATLLDSPTEHKDLQLRPPSLAGLRGGHPLHTCTHASTYEVSPIIPSSAREPARSLS